jgi:serine/threonine protein phosphatase PrpC
MPQQSLLAFEFAALTDIGCKRSNNEDSFGYDAEQQIFAVCDGMGGNSAGEVASSMAVRSLIDSYAASSRIACESNGAAIQPVENRLMTAIVEANRVVRDTGMSNPEYYNMGTTLVCVCFDGERAVIGNVGDSRAYLVRDGYCAQITEDHSYLEEQIQKGNITPEMAAASNMQSVITRAIGAAEDVEPDFYAARLEPGDMVLLATDGLTRYASPEHIAAQIAAMAANCPDLEAVCRVLVEHAKQCGGVDNITCVLLRASEVAQAIDESEAAGTTAI